MYTNIMNMPFIPVWKENGYYYSLSEASKGQLNVDACPKKILKLAFCTNTFPDARFMCFTSKTEKLYEGNIPVFKNTARIKYVQF
jgi:hypothetical protein